MSDSNSPSVIQDSVYTQWLSRDPDPKTREELQRLIDNNNTDELNARFSNRLEFGTAGLRGTVGAGPNRMNRLVIQETATGLGQYLLESQDNAKEHGVIIGYDGRPDSRQFAHDAASVLTALGIRVYLTHDVAATPIVGFGVLNLNTAAGIVVTASHNPPEYNGFKVYWNNGAQIIPPQDSGIAHQIDIAATKPLNTLPLDEAEKQGLLVWLKEDFYSQYRKALGESPLISNVDVDGSLIGIAYTAMHGVGARMAEDLLSDAGFPNVFSVAEQREPDGSFPTVNFPNPEEPGAMDLVIAEATRNDCEIAIANDPDADRMAAAARKRDGSYQLLTGDQVGVLLADYLMGLKAGNPCLVGATIVSSSMLGKMANANAAQYYETLTGFKWLTNVAMNKESVELPFLFAYEEALGYTIGTAVRDKDGLSALVIFAQMTAQLAARGLTVWDQLSELYRKHGFYFTAQQNIALTPDTPNIGEALRRNPPQTIAGHKVLSMDDLKDGVRHFADGSTEDIALPPSDVLTFRLEKGARIVVRPSGTEPKIKCYYEVVVDMNTSDGFSETEAFARGEMETLIREHQASLPK
ncbi:phospho-sugar mutase [Parasalinivibrio latis]|uniref:phospho-sugar mutase n=1 Tax=Parasalinivibrio latis TaxID=2952610 RepID=UPI0030DDFFCE